MIEHVTVFHEDGKFAGWPANHGMWIWGDEILVGFALGDYFAEAKGHHIRNPQGTRFARSLDGGRTWAIEHPENIDKQPEAVLPGNIDFAHRDFAWLLRTCHSHDEGPSRCLASYDRGKTWVGPYFLPKIGLGVITRTDYIVESKDECTAMLTCSKPGPDGQGVVEGRVVCVRTKDGGKTFNVVGWVGDVPRGFEIMPSTVRCSETQLVTGIRCDVGDVTSYIAVRRSDDNGATWKELARIPHKMGSNPASLVRTKTGMLCMAYADRGELAIFATLSTDNGTTWSEPVRLRDDCVNPDMGYCKSVLRGDGRIVTAYYYSTKDQPEMHIAATIWQPEAARRHEGGCSSCSRG